MNAVAEKQDARCRICDELLRSSIEKTQRAHHICLAEQGETIRKTSAATVIRNMPASDEHAVILREIAAQLADFNAAFRILFASNLSK